MLHTSDVRSSCGYAWSAARDSRPIASCPGAVVAPDAASRRNEKSGARVGSVESSGVDHGARVMSFQSSEALSVATLRGL